MSQTVGIDISKDTLDAYRQSDGLRLQVRNDSDGHRAVLRWIGRNAKLLVVFEATGVYHRELELMLGARGIPFVKVNPRQARRFTQATERLAKTNRVDAAMLARMGAVLALAPQAPRQQNLHNLRDLLDARPALIKDRTAPKIRRSTALALIKRQLDARLKRVDDDLERIEAELAALANMDAGLAERLAILRSIPGVGDVTAIALIIDMPELGELEGKAGSEPGRTGACHPPVRQWQGKERIQGGRATLRQALLPGNIASTPISSESTKRSSRPGRRRRSR